jgi:hypothetical protein
VAAALVVLTGVLVTVACEQSTSPSAASADSSRQAAARIRAVTLDARKRPAPDVLPHLKRLGATHVALVTFGFQSAPATPNIRMHTGGGWYSESDAGIRRIARRVDSLGMGLILKPHLWIGGYDEDGQSRHRVGFDSEKKWRAWEKQYHRFMMHYARLAEETSASVLVVGTELARPVRERSAFWRRLIRDVRAVYGGKLTYAANWYEEYEQVPFWKALDYVGVQAYFPLADAEDPSLARLRRGWQRHRKALRRVHERSNRPVLFTEVGYRSAPEAARTPWQWPSEADTATAPALQTRLYRAFFETVWQAPWLAGAVLWKWHGNPARIRPHGFSPQGKPAETVIRRGFTEP